MDSSKTYTKSELKQIAFKLIEGKECCQLLQVSEQTSFFRNKLITSQDSIIDIRQKQLTFQEELIESFKISQANYEEELKKQKRKNKAANISWPLALTLIVLGGFIATR